MTYCEISNGITSKIQIYRKISVYIKDKFEGNLARHLSSLHLIRKPWKLMQFQGGDLHQAFSLAGQGLTAACAPTATCWAWSTKL